MARSSRASIGFQSPTAARTCVSTLPSRSLEAVRLVGRKRVDVDMDDAEAVDAMVLAAVGEDLADALLAVPDDDDRMGDESRLAGRVGDLAEHRIEQERHVVVDDGDDGERAAVADDGRGRCRRR